VFFVRVANKGLKLDGASTFNDEGFQLVVFSVGCTSDSMTARSKTRLAGDSLDSKEKESEGAHTPVFCKRVRKRLIGKELWKHSFLKSVEEFENEGFNFSGFARKSEKSERSSGFCPSGERVVLWNVDFNAESTEFAELRRRNADPSLRSG
jgi:hypothetical protein